MRQHFAEEKNRLRFFDLGGEMSALRYKASKANIVVIAAIAFGTHLVSFRTQKLSRNT